jgi:DNA-binding transcriptional LysR family regulator
VDTRVLQQFLSVVKHQSIGRAAEAMGLTQPAMSKSVQRLEALLGMKLLERTATGVIPTVFGAALVESAKSVIFEVNRMRERIEDLRDGRGGHIIIGAGPSLLELQVSQAVIALKRSVQNIRVTTTTGSVGDLLPALHVGEIDIVLGTAPELPVDPDLISKRWFADEIGIIARIDHPLRQRADISLADLLDQKWVLTPSTHTFTKGCIRCFAAAGLAIPPPDIISSSIPMVRSIVSETNHLSFMPLTNLGHADISLLQVNGGTWTRNVHILTRARGSFVPAIGLFINKLEEIVSTCGRA